MRKFIIKLILLITFVTTVPQVFGAGLAQLTFSTKIYYNFKIKQNYLEKPLDAALQKTYFSEGRYIFVVEDFNQCIIRMYNLNNWDVKIFAGNSYVAVPPLATLQGGCFIIPEMRRKASVEIFETQSDNSIVIIMKTPDYGINMVRVVMVYLEKAGY